MAMDYRYDWRFTPPQKKLAVHMPHLKDGAEAFDSTLLLTRRELSTGRTGKRAGFASVMT